MNILKEHIKTSYYLCIVVMILGLGIISCSEDTIDEQQTGSISGMVIATEDDMPLANVEISTNPSSSTVFTDEEGMFSIPNVVVDSYSVQAETDGFETGFEAVTVTADENSTVAFSLDVLAEGNDAPSVPVLLFPEDGANDIDIQVELAWDAEDPEGDELTYTIEVRNGTTNEIRNIEVVQDTTFLLTDLDLSTNYFWQVTVSDDVNDPASSEFSQFTTLESPANPFIFVRRVEGNNVIFSGNQDADSGNDTNVNVLQITQESNNSFRPRREVNVGRIGFLRTVGGNTQLFTMDLAGEDVQQLTNAIPVTGFRQEEIHFTWANDGQNLYYPNFDRLLSINNDGSGNTVIYQTPDGSLISEVDVPDFDDDLVVIKTNDLNGYNARIVLVRISTGVEEAVILEGELGAAGGINISANGDRVLYFRDMTGSENGDYRIFSGRLFIYDIVNDITTSVTTDVSQGENDLDPRFSPSEGGVIFTRILNNTSAIPAIFIRDFDDTNGDDELFTESFMPDWE